MVIQKIHNNSGRVRKIQEGETFQSFDCGDTELNDFLLYSAHDYRETLLAVSYVYEEDKDVIAYFSLSNDSLSYSDFIEKKLFNKLNRRINNAKRMREYPAMKIGRFAVMKDSKEKGIGSSLLDIIKYSLVNNPQSGCRFITVDAYNGAIDFYQKNGFVMMNEFQSNKKTQPMFFDLSQIL